MADGAERQAYRLYLINRAGRIDAVAMLVQATSDEQAAREAIVLAGEGRAELWLGSRLVARIESAARSLTTP